MRRREALCATFTLPFSAAVAAAEKVWRIGCVRNTAPTQAQTGEGLPAFDNAMHALGRERGRHYRFEWRYAAGRPELYLPLTAELVASGVDLILAWGNLAASAARQSTATIPVVMLSVSDPVGKGLVASLARPGGNLTGVADQGDELDGKGIELLREMVPALRRLAVIFDPGNAYNVAEVAALEVTVRQLGVALQPVELRSAADFGAAARSLELRRPQGLTVFDQPVNLGMLPQIVELAGRLRIASVFQSSRWVRAGGLVSYAPSLIGQQERAANYVDRITRGAKPADLPIEQPTKFELSINRRTAQTLGLTIPRSLLLRADEVIE